VHSGSRHETTATRNGLHGAFSEQCSCHRHERLSRHREVQSWAIARRESSGSSIYWLASTESRRHHPREHFEWGDHLAGFAVYGAARNGERGMVVGRNATARKPPREDG
jgi:hypothetical protein